MNTDTETRAPSILELILRPSEIPESLMSQFANEGWPDHYRFTVDEYERMIDAGILHEGHRVEMIHGHVLNKRPVGDGRVATLLWLNRIFQIGLNEKGFVAIQTPLRMATSVLEPDVSILRPRSDNYGLSKPTSADALLVIDVADPSLELHPSIKRSFYASDGIPEFWIVDPNKRTLVVYRQPGMRDYADVRTIPNDELIFPLAFPDFVLTPQQLFPPPPPV